MNVFQFMTSHMVWYNLITEASGKILKYKIKNKPSVGSVALTKCMTKLYKLKFLHMLSNLQICIDLRDVPFGRGKVW